MNLPIQYVSTESAPPPRGHYSQATIHNGTIYLATQLGVCLNDPSTPVVGSIEEQTCICFKNIENILLSVGSDLSKIIKVTIFISDISLWGEVNKIYIDIMGKNKPARGVIPVKELHLGAQVAVDVIAAI
jgi:2-iminobutanoate/2-iminopropanoate deaminase